MLDTQGSAQWTVGHELYQDLTKHTPQPVNLRQHSLFQAILTGVWDDLDTQQDANDFVCAILPVLKPSFLQGCWITKPALEGHAWGTHLQNEKGERFSPLNLNAFDSVSDQCTLQYLIDCWHDAHGLCRAFFIAGRGLVICIGRNGEGGMKQLELVDCDTFRTPRFDNTAGHTVYDTYHTCAIVFHLGERANSGHYRCAIRCANKWWLYEDGQLPEIQKDLLLPLHSKIVQVHGILSRVDPTTWLF